MSQCKEDMVNKIDKNMLTKNLSNNNFDNIDDNLIKNLPQQNNEVQIIKPLNIFNSKDMEDVITDETEMKLDKTYQLNEVLTFKEQNLVFDKDHLLGLEMKGNGNIQIQFEEGQSDYPLMSAFIQISSNKNKTIIPFNNALIKTRQNLTIKIKKNFQKDVPLTAKFINMSQQEVDFNETYEVQTIFSTEINFVLTDIKKYIDKTSMNRIKFIIGSTLAQQKLKGDEELSLYINKNKGFPTKQKYDFQATGSLKDGLIKTIPQKSKYFCKTNKCKYYITIYVKNVHKIFFQPRITNHKLKMLNENNFHMIEELQENEIVKYELDLKNIQGEWLLQMIPIKNEIQLFINPDYEPEDLNQYKYKTNSKGAQEFIITEYQQQQFEYKNTKFFIAFKTNDKINEISTFTFHVYSKQVGSMIQMIKGQTESGFLADNENLNFFLDLRADEPQSYSILLTLTTLSNKVEMIIKECSEDDAVCQINEKDIQNSYYENAQSQYGNKLFRVARQDHDQSKLIQNRMMLNVNCIGKGYAYKNEIIDNFHVSQDCIFAVGIYNNSNDGKPVSFKFENQGLDIIKKIKLNTNENITIAKDTKQYLKIPLSIETYNIYKYAIVKVVMLTGDASIYLSNFTEKPSQADFDERLDLINKSNLELESKQYGIYFELKQSNNKGLSFAIQANEYSVINLTVQLSNNDQDEQFEIIQLNDIIKRQILRQDSIRLSDKEIYYKDFQILIDQFSYGSNYIEISIDTNHVDLQICLQKDVIKMDHNKPCDYESITGLLKVTKDELNYGVNQIIVFSVRKILKSDQIYTNFPIQFSVHYSIDQKFQSLILHQPGQIYERNIIENSHISMQINLTNMKQFAVIVLTTESSNVHATIAFKREDVQTKNQANLDQHNFAYQINNNYGFKQKHCRSKNCYIYCTVHNQGNKPSKFSLYYLIDNGWISLKNGHEIFVPSKLNTNFYLQGEQNQPITFFYSSQTAALTGIGNLMEEEKFLQDKDQLKYKLEDEFTFKFKTAVDKYGQIIMNQKSINKFKKPLALFQLIPKYNMDNNHFYKESFVYNAENIIKVVAHSGVQKLQPFKEKEDILEEENFYIYKIYQEEFKEFTIFISLTSGDAMMYLNYGNESIPSLKQY